MNQAIKQLLHITGIDSEHYTRDEVLLYGVFIPIVGVLIIGLATTILCL